jgi:hemoglobin/transferrin/lactoferrin receptor protein
VILISVVSALVRRLVRMGCLGSVLVMSALVESAAAQTAARADRSLSGHVEDPSGGAISGATVVVSCGGSASSQTGAAATGTAAVRRDAVSDGAGNFVIRGLPAARCSVDARTDLFTPRTFDLDLTSQRSAFLRVVMTLAGIQSEVTVTPARGEQERTFDVPEPVSVTTREEIDARPHQVLSQVLRGEPGILVQQTTTAQGSPFIRGFSAQRIVYLVDGIRYNVATARAGATQYLGWINPGAVQRLEVVRGPSSVQYGSDALGGTINVISERAPIGGRRNEIAGHAGVMFGSADRSGLGEASLIVQTPLLSVRGGGSARKIDDLRPGDGIDSHSSLTRFLGLPSDVLYTRMPETGYSQGGGYVAATLPLGGPSGGATGASRTAGSSGTGYSSSLTGLYMHEQQHDVSRYDRVIGGDGLYRSAFDPQRLDFGYLRYDRAQTGPFNAVQGTFSINRQEDDRLEQTLPTALRDTEQASVTAYGYQGQATTLAARKHALTFGGEVYDEYIDTARVQFLDNPSRQVTLRPEIPDGTRYTSTSVFVQDSTEVLAGRVSLRGGLRYGNFSFRTKAQPAFNVMDEEVTSDAVTFNAGAVVALHESLNATFSVNRGFRAANAFDLGALGVTGGGYELSPITAIALGALAGTSDGADAVSSGQAVEALRPESMYAYEGGLKFRSSKLSASLSVFDLELHDQILRRTVILPVPLSELPANLQAEAFSGVNVTGQDAQGRVFVDVAPNPVITRVNIDRARVRGVEMDAHARVTTGWIAGAYFSISNGRELPSEAFMRRMPPAMGGFTLKWEPEQRSWWIEGVGTFARTQTRLAGGDLSDARIGARRTRAQITSFFNGTATVLGLVQNGVLVETGETLPQVLTRLVGTAANSQLYTETPGFFVLGLRGGMRVGTNVDVSVLADNLTDKNYRWHGSGVDAPGFNVQARVRYRF